MVDVMKKATDSDRVIQVEVAPRMQSIESSRFAEPQSAKQTVARQLRFDSTVHYF